MPSHVNKISYLIAPVCETMREGEAVALLGRGLVEERERERKRERERERERDTDTVVFASHNMIGLIITHFPMLPLWCMSYIYSPLNRNPVCVCVCVCVCTPPCADVWVFTCRCMATGLQTNQCLSWSAHIVSTELWIPPTSPYKQGIAELCVGLSFFSTSTN